MSPDRHPRRARSYLADRATAVQQHRAYSLWAAGPDEAGILIEDTVGFGVGDVAHALQSGEHRELRRAAGRAWQSGGRILHAW